MAIRIPTGATVLEEWPKGTSVNKLKACLEAMSMSPKALRLGGGQLCVFGLRPDLQLAIEVRYDEGVTAKGAPSFKFAGAKVHDPVGIIVNMEADYHIMPRDAKSMGLTLEKAKELSSRRSAEYNLGEQMRVKIALFETSTAMNQWLDEWLELLKLDHKRQSPNRKPKPTNADLLMGADWSSRGTPQ